MKTVIFMTLVTAWLAFVVWSPVPLAMWKD